MGLIMSLVGFTLFVRKKTKNIFYLVGLLPPKWVCLFLVVFLVNFREFRPTTLRENGDLTANRRDGFKQSGDVMNGNGEVPWLLNGLICSHCWWLDTDISRRLFSPEYQTYSEIKRWVSSNVPYKSSSRSSISWGFQPWTSFFSRECYTLLQRFLHLFRCSPRFATCDAQQFFLREDRRKQRAKWWDPWEEDEPPSTVWDAQLGSWKGRLMVDVVVMLKCWTWFIWPLHKKHFDRLQVTCIDIL